MKNKLHFFLLASFIMISCDYYDDRLCINNNIDKDIYVAFSQDTVLNLGANNTFLLSDRLVRSRTKKNIGLPEKNGWLKYVKNSKDNKLHVFIIEQDTLAIYDASEIVKKQLYLKRIDLEIRNLESKNWEISTK